MIGSWIAGTDPMTVAILAAVMLMEDVRRVPAGSVVFRRSMAGPWRATAFEWKAVTLLSWWSPLSTAVVVPGFNPNAEQAASDPGERWRTVRWHAQTLAVLGGSVVLTVVLGIPIATARVGAVGFIVALGSVLLLCFLIGIIGFVALHRIGWDRRSSALRGLAFCSPFRGPSAYRELIEAVAAGVPPVRVARWLIAPDDFVAWVRPRVWDALHGGEDLELERVLGREEMEEIATRPVAARDGFAVSVCGRCGASWLIEGECPACRVGLTRIHASEGARPSDYPAASG